MLASRTALRVRAHSRSLQYASRARAGPSSYKALDRRLYSERKAGPSSCSSVNGTSEAKNEESKEDTKDQDPSGFLGSIFPFLAQRSSAFDTALSAVVGLGMGASTFFLCVRIIADRLLMKLVFAGGVTYVAWYKSNVLYKVSCLVLPSGLLRTVSCRSSRLFNLATTLLLR
jgi:hypothetical protein